MIRFSKYHGCGNDFIIVEEASVEGRSYSRLAREICHRQLGVGGDGLILVRREPLEMLFFNSDGSQAPMCGNGLRCFARYCVEEEICRRESFSVRTQAGLMGVRIAAHDPFLVELSMGKPDFNPRRCGIETDRDSFLRQKLQLKNSQTEVSSCFMGTVHTVVWMDRLEWKDSTLESLGREICEHPVFTEKTNVNFVQVLDGQTLKLATYERGAGMTLACGTGACACAVIGAAESRCTGEVNVLLPYGQLHIQQLEDGVVRMTGPAVKIAQGCYTEEKSGVSRREE